MLFFHTSCCPFAFHRQGTMLQRGVYFSSFDLQYACRQTGYFRVVVFFTSLQRCNFLVFVFLPFFWHLPLTGSFQIRPAPLAFSNQSETVDSTNLKPGLVSTENVLSVTLDFRPASVFVTRPVYVSFMPVTKCSPLQTLINIIMKQVDYLI